MSLVADTNPTMPDAACCPDAPCCTVVELRDYTLHPRERETLIDLFDREFLEAQEEWGVHVIGQFRDLDRPDHFVWLRGFTGMDARGVALRSFYTGPVWAEFADAANATMIDSDDVLLLRSASPSSGFLHPPADRGGAVPPGCYVVTVAPREVSLAAADGVVAEFVTEYSENTYPRLPIREGVDVTVRVQRFDSVPDIDGRADAVTMRLAPTSRSRLQ
jgi:hypothetical protein